MNNARSALRDCAGEATVIDLNQVRDRLGKAPVLGPECTRPGGAVILAVGRAAESVWDYAPGEWQPG